MVVKKTQYANPANYNANTITLTDGDPAALEVDVNGNLKTVSTGASPAGAISPDSIIINPSSNFTRPANTTQYVIGQLVANSVTAGSVVPLSWTVSRLAAGNFFVRRARLKKSTASLTSASFVLYLYAASPTCANGDGATFSTTESTFLGSFNITCSTAFSDPAADGQGVPTAGNEVGVALASGQTIYGLLSAANTYTPGSAEVFTVVLEVYQN